MGFDAVKLDAIERIMDQLATELGRAATNVEVRNRAQVQGVTGSMGTTHRYKAEIEERRRSKAEVKIVGSFPALETPEHDFLSGPVVELHGAVDGFSSKLSSMVRAAMAAEHQHFAETLSAQHATFQLELATLHAIIADLRETIDLVVVENEQIKVEETMATARAEAAGAELDRVRSELSVRIEDKHALQVRVTRLESEEQRHREAGIELRIARNALNNEIAALKKERDGLRARLDDTDPLRFALQEWQNYRSRDMRDATEIIRPKVSLEKK